MSDKVFVAISTTVHDGGHRLYALTKDGDVWFKDFISWGQGNFAKEGDWELVEDRVAQFDAARE